MRILYLAIGRSTWYHALMQSHSSFSTLERGGLESDLLFLRNGGHSGKPGHSGAPQNSVAFSVAFSADLLLRILSSILSSILSYFSATSQLLLSRFSVACARDLNDEFHNEIFKFKRLDVRATPPNYPLIRGGLTYNVKPKT